MLRFPLQCMENVNIMDVWSIITCSAVILYADWSIGVRSGAVYTL